MAESQKKDSSSVSSKEKNSLLDLDIGKDFLSSWKSMSMAEGDVMDFDLTPGNKKSFNFDKADMDFNLDGDFGKISSFNMDMSDLDISPPLKNDGKLKETLKESSSEMNKGKADRFAFAFDFDELENFNFESSLTKEGSKAQKHKDKKESSPSGSGCQDEESSMHTKEIGSMTTIEAGPQKSSLPGTGITFDMDILVGGGADLELSKENCLLNLAKDDAVNLECSAAIDEVASEKAKSHPETKIASKELPKVSQSESLVSAEPVELEACTGHDAVQNLSPDSLSKHEPTGGNLSEALDRVNSVSTNATGSNGNQDVNVISIDSSSCHYKHTLSENSRLQTVEVSEKTNGGKSKVGVEDHVINDREGTELGQVKSLVENTSTTGAVSGILCDKPSARENHEPASEIFKLPLVSQPVDLSEKEAGKGREPLVTCSKYFIRSEKPECHIPDASTQISSSSSKKTGFAQLSLVEGRDGDSTQSDKKLVSLPMQYSKTLLKGLPQIQRQESHMDLKISREVCSADGLENGKQLSDSSTTQNNFTAKTKSLLGQREMSMKNLDILRSSCVSFPLEVNKNASQNSGNPKTLATIPISKSIPAEGHKLSSIEHGKKTPDLPGLKLQCFKFDSRKTSNREDVKLVGSIGQNRHLLRKTPSDVAHFPNSQKQAPSILSAKRKTLEQEDAANMIALHPSKRLMQSSTSGRNVVQTSEKVLEKEVSNHSNMENKSIKSTVVNSQVPTFHIPQEAKIREVNMSFSIESDNIIKQAEAYAKKLDGLRNMLKKKHDEAKEILVQAIVNNNKLLMLNNPLLDHKIRATQNLFARLSLNSVHG